MKIDLNFRQIAGIMMLAVAIMAISVIAKYSPVPLFPNLSDGEVVGNLMVFVIVIVGLLHSTVMILDIKNIRLGWVPIAFLILAIIYLMLNPTPSSNVEFPRNVTLASLFIFILLPIADVIDHCNN